MNIPKQYMEIIINEFKNVEKMAKEVSLPEDKLYIFSSCYGTVNRVINFYYDPILVFMHQIFQTAHLGINQRLIARTPAISTSCPDEMIDSLFKYLSELIPQVEKEDEDGIRKVLQKFSILSYSVTGNGFYLYLTKKLNL